MSEILYVASCVHLGARESREDLFEKSLKVAKRIGAKVALIGDLLDMGLFVGTKHTGSVYDQSYGIDAQSERAAKLLAPVRDSIVAILQGNHEERLYKATGIEANKGVAKAIGRPEVFRSSTAILRNKRFGYRIFLGHGSNRSDFNRLLVGYDGLDAIVLGHTHTLSHEVVTKRESGHRSDIQLVRAGTYLEEPRYGRMALYPPNPVGAAWIFMRKDKMYVDLGVEPRL